MLSTFWAEIEHGFKSILFVYIDLIKLRRGTVAAEAVAHMASLGLIKITSREGVVFDSS